MLPRSVEDEELRPLDEGHGHVAFEQGGDEILGQLAHGPIEELDHIVTGVEALQPSVWQHDAVADARLLTEDDGHVSVAQRFVHFLVRDEPFPHARVRPLVTAAMEKVILRSHGLRIETAIEALFPLADADKEGCLQHRVTEPGESCGT